MNISSENIEKFEIRGGKKMPNHITNIITYNGDRKHIEKMLEDIKIDELGIGTVDLNKIVPMPDDVYKGNLGRKERELYGNKNWYDWSIANWGTKWNACDTVYDAKNKLLQFNTAWSAPKPIFVEIARANPNAKLEIVYQLEEEDVDVEHVCYVENGYYYDG